MVIRIKAVGVQRYSPVASLMVCVWRVAASLVLIGRGSAELYSQSAVNSPP